jgi:hypothetical protein
MQCQVIFILYTYMYAFSVPLTRPSSPCQHSLSFEEFTLLEPIVRKICTFAALLCKHLRMQPLVRSGAQVKAEHRSWTITQHEGGRVLQHVHTCSVDVGEKQSTFDFQCFWSIRDFPKRFSRSTLQDLEPSPFAASLHQDKHFDRLWRPYPELLLQRPAPQTPLH